MEQPRLEFWMKLGYRKELRIGVLRLIDTGATYCWEATSGIPYKQALGHIWTRNAGPLPPSNAVREPYRVRTALIHSNNLTAVGEHLFAILPYTIWSVDGTRKRTNTALHFDANHRISPGSGGCIVFVNTVSWDAFREHMKRLAEAGISELPLEVIYT